MGINATSNWIVGPKSGKLITGGGREELRKLRNEERMKLYVPLMLRAHKWFKRDEHDEEVDAMMGKGRAARAAKKEDKGTATPDNDEL